MLYLLQRHKEKIELKHITNTKMNMLSDPSEWTLRIRNLSASSNWTHTNLS